MEPEEKTQAAVLGGALVLGVVQGLTEFLPVSSSGHFVLLEQFMPVGEQHILFVLVLHIGTLVPVLWFYRDSLLEMLRDPFVGEGDFTSRPGVRMAAAVVLASIPTAIIGLALEDFFDWLFSTPATLTVSFAITASLLLLTRRLDDGELELKTVPWHYIALLGVAQGLAITPGISRSGSTIAVALLLGLKRDFAARLSFLMSVPAILGGTLIKTLKADNFDGMDPGALLLGGVSSMVVGYLALVLLVKLVNDGGLHYFAYYCYAAAVVAGLIAVFA